MPAESASRSGAPSSTMEIARATARRSPASTPWITDATSTGRSLAVAGTRVGRGAGGVRGRRAGDGAEGIADRSAVLALLQQRRVVVGGHLRADHRQVHLLTLETAEQPGGAASGTRPHVGHRRPSPTRLRQDAEL